MAILFANMLVKPIGGQKKPKIKMEIKHGRMFKQRRGVKLNLFNEIRSLYERFIIELPCAHGDSG